MINDSFVLTLRLDTNTEDEKVLEKRFRIASHIYNVMVKEARKRIHKLKRDKEFKRIMKNYRTSKMLSVSDKKILSDLRLLYGLSEYQFHSYLDRGQSQFKLNIDSCTRQKIGTTVWKSAETNMFRKGRHIYYKKSSNMKSVEGKSNKTGIRFRENKILWNGLQLSVIIKNKDTYAQEVLLKHEVKYCRIVRKWHKHKYRYYVQLVMKGTPPLKHRLDINDTRKVGIDIGPSTIAVVSESGIVFEELAADVNNIDNELAKLQRKLDRQRRTNNPNNYNEDGTIRRQSKNFKRSWIVSRHQKLTQDKIRTLSAKKVSSTKQSHEILANRILLLGTDIYVEDMNMQALAKRMKETKISEKTNKYQKKKRYGKSISNHAPAMLIEIINRKLSSVKKHVIKVNTYSIKASQLNHITGEYNKAELSERWKELDDTNIVQRDLYSAFLLMNCSDTVTIDINSCFDTFSDFKKKHNDLINTLRENKKAGKKYPSCMGI